MTLPTIEAGLTVGGWPDSLLLLLGGTGDLLWAEADVLRLEDGDLCAEAAEDLWIKAGDLKMLLLLRLSFLLPVWGTLRSTESHHIYGRYKYRSHMHIYRSIVLHTILHASRGHFWPKWWLVQTFILQNPLFVMKIVLFSLGVEIQFF